MIREKTTVKLEVSAQCPSHSRADISVRDQTFSIDEPVARGGTNEGPTPTDTALAALVGCTNVIGHKCAAKLGIDIGHLNISVVADFDRRGVTLTEEIDLPFAAIRLEVKSDGPATQAELQQVADETAKYCPLSKMFRAAGTVVTEDWSAA
jgi:uncharacterized OsmC-like protein